MPSDTAAPAQVGRRRIIEQRAATNYLAKIRNYVEAYERGGEARQRSMASLEADWAQIQHYQAWAVKNCHDDPVALEICHLYAERGALLLPLLSAEQAIVWLRPAIEAARMLQLPQAELLHLRNLGLIYDRAGRYDEALASYRAALTMSTTLAAAPTRADLLHRIGKVHRNLGKQYALAAEQWYRDALDAMQAVGDACGEARVRIDLGNVRANQGYYQQALEYFAPAKTILARPECGDTRDEAMLLGYLGNAYRNLGRYQQADTAYNAAVEMADVLRERKMIAEHRFNQALLCRDIGRLAEMKVRLEQSHEEAQRYRSERDIAKVLNGRGGYYAAAGLFSTALDEHNAAIATFEQLGAHFLADYARADKGRTLIMAGRPAEALECLRTAASAGEATQHPLHHQQRAALLAQGHLLLNDTLSALELLVAVRTLDADPNTAVSRHRAAVFHGVALARNGITQAAELLRLAAQYATERIVADSWELAAFNSRGLALSALALLGASEQPAELLLAAERDYTQVLHRCDAPGIRSETAAMLGLLRPLDTDQQLRTLQAAIAGDHRS